MKATLCIDDAVGETRRVLLDPFGKPFRASIERWSERGTRPGLDEIWWGRVKARMPGNRGWFVDLGIADHEGVIEPTKAAAVAEGALLAVRVKSEAWADKGPVLSLADISPSTPKPDRPQRHASAQDAPFLRGVEIVATLKEQVARSYVDAATEEAQTRVVSLPGGGNIAIDVTRGMVVVDVDAGDRIAENDAETFALKLNLAAAEVAARQISLRGLGGLAVVDFVRMTDRRNQRSVAERFRKSLAQWLGRSSEVLELSSLGVCESAIARRARPLHEALAPGTAEREGLDTLRLIESEGWRARSARIRAAVSRQAFEWLENDHIGWKDKLAGRIGARWTLESDNRQPGRPEVWSMG